MGDGTEWILRQFTRDSHPPPPRPELSNQKKPSLQYYNTVTLPNSCGAFAAAITIAIRMTILIVAGCR